MRIAVLLFSVCVCAYAIALQGTSIYEMVSSAYQVTLVGAFVPLVFGLYWKRATTQGAIFAIVLGVLTWILFRYLAARAACIQLGAVFGTIMTANVWMRILPAQRRMVAALKENKEPDQAEAFRAKTRSKHNTFIVIPVVFLMLSNHFPGTYHWITVSLLVLAGWAAAKIVRRA